MYTDVHVRANYLSVLLDDGCSVAETKVKNVKRTEMGDKIGRIHMKKQNLDTMQVKRIKVLRDTGGKKESEGADQDGADSSSGRKRNSSEKGSKKRKAEDL